MSDWKFIIAVIAVAVIVLVVIFPSGIVGATTNYPGIVTNIRAYTGNACPGIVVSGCHFSSFQDLGITLADKTQVSFTVACSAYAIGDSVTVQHQTGIYDSTNGRSMFHNGWVLLDLHQGCDYTP